MMPKAQRNIEEVTYWFLKSPVKFQGHTEQINNFDLNWAFPDCIFQFEFIDGFEMMHSAWCSIEEVPFCFSRSSISRLHGQKIDDLKLI